MWNFVKYNINFFHEIKYWIKIINSENNILSQNINENLVDIAIKTLPKEPYDENTWDDWTTAIKEISQFTGKDLYMPLRIALTGLNKGPELKYLIPLLNKSTILKKFGKI